MAFGNRIENSMNSPAVIRSLILGGASGKLTPGEISIGYPPVSFVSDLCTKASRIVVCCWSDASDSVSASVCCGGFVTPLGWIDLRS